MAAITPCMHLAGRVARDRVDAHHPLGPRLEVAPAVLREAEQVGREAARELARRAASTTSISPSVGDGVEQLGRRSLRRNGLVARGALGREPAGHERALLGVPRVVLGDHVVLLGRPQRPVALAADEHLGPALDVDEVGVPGDADEPGRRVAVHRIVGPQPRERLVHAVEVGVEALVEQIRLRVHGHGACVAR